MNEPHHSLIFVRGEGGGDEGLARTRGSSHLNAKRLIFRGACPLRFFCLLSVLCATCVALPRRGDNYHVSPLTDVGRLWYNSNRNPQKQRFED